MDLARVGLLLNADLVPDELLASARTADDLGFGALWYADERFYRETYSGLTLCATATERIPLGPGVTDPSCSAA